MKRCLRSCATLVLALMGLFQSGSSAILLAAEPPTIQVIFPARVEVFDLCELRITLPDEFLQLPATQIHDAYDADRDGQYVRLSAEFVGPGESVRMPGFAMRERPDGPWEWRVRFAPRRVGEWQVLCSVDACIAGKDIKIDLPLEQRIDVVETKAQHGPLVLPGRDDPPGYLRALHSDGSSEGLWLFGTCRAWVAEDQNRNNPWSAYETIDRDTELLAPMRAGGLNLLNQWMAPWEFLIIHHDRAEFWRIGGRWRRVPLANDISWSSYQCYDQGRAKAFDDLVRRCEGNATRPPVYLLLAPLPHQCFQAREHPWGSQESGWSPYNDGGAQSLERLNGFSGFLPEMNVWDFFAADPNEPLRHPRCMLFDHQANYYRYLIARWGYSRALGVWVIVDELDAVGDVAGLSWLRTGWWGHPECERWLGHVFQLFRGSLRRSDGLVYDGDPYHHPLHAATTSFGATARGVNNDWSGIAIANRPDILGFHWYLQITEGMTWMDVWLSEIDEISQFSEAQDKMPRLISEFGAPDRGIPSDVPFLGYPTLYHHAIWTAVFSGQAGTPMDWNDGKEFGELRWRNRKGAFDKEHYPIDLIAEVQALRKFLGGLSPDDLRRCANDEAVQCLPGKNIRAFALYSAPAKDAVYGWLFSPAGGDASVVLAGLAPGKYVLSWYDPWTGDVIPESLQHILAVDNSGKTEINASNTLARLYRTSAPFPMAARKAQGHDIAFKLETK